MISRRLTLPVIYYWYKYDSYPDWRISPHADRRKMQIVYNTGHHRPCGGQCFTPHTVCSCPASLLHRANNRRTCYRFFNFWPWGLPLSQSSPKGEMTYYPQRSTILQNFSPITQMVRDMCYQSFFHFLA